MRLCLFSSVLVCLRSAHMNTRARNKQREYGEREEGRERDRQTDRSRRKTTER